MTKSGTALFLIIVVALALLYGSAYIVREYEQAVIVQFGKPVRIVDEPGLKFKIPIYEEARRFEKRWLEWDGDANQITTLDKRYIYIDVFARWRIKDPLVFIETLKDENRAQGRLDDIIDSATRNVIANHKLIEAIRSTNRTFEHTDEVAILTREDTEAGDVPAEDEKAKKGASPDSAAPSSDTKDNGTGPAESPVKRVDEPSTSWAAPHEEMNRADDQRSRELYLIETGREKLTRLILEKASTKAEQLGIELKDVQIKRIDYIESVQAKVFDRMISERKRVAEAFRSQGQGRSAEILGQMEKELKKVRSEAYRKSQEIMGRADAEAAAIYAEAYKKDPEFYNFVKTMESYQQTIDQSSWLMLSTDADYARHLRTMQGEPR